MSISVCCVFLKEIKLLLPSLLRSGACDQCSESFGLRPADVHFLIALSSVHGTLARYVKLRVVHAPGMPGTFSPPPRVSDPDKHHGTCVTHVLWCMRGWLTSGFLWSRWRGKRSRHSRCMHNSQVYLSGKMSIVTTKPSRNDPNHFFSVPGPWGPGMVNCIFSITWLLIPNSAEI